MRTQGSRGPRPNLRRLRPIIWRYRFVLAALCLAWVAVLLIPALQPAPASHLVTVAARDLPAGTALRPGDVESVNVVTMPGSTRAEEDLVGERLAVGVPAGLPLVETMLVGPGVAAGAPPGTVVTPIRLADPALMQLLQIGDRLDLYLAPFDAGAADPASELVTSGALVLSLLGGGGSGGGLLGTGTTAENSGVVVVAVSANDANVLTGASGLAAFRAVVVPDRYASSE